jgi:hypothetical protein
MKRAKITITCTVEYDLNPEFYPEGLTPEQMIEIDRQNAFDDPFSFFDMDNADFQVKAEVIKESHYDDDYPKEPIGGDNPYYRCVYCKKSDPEINGELKNHSINCEYRKMKEGKI